MSSDPSLQPSISKTTEQAIQALVWSAAIEVKGNSLEVLSLLRLLEALHRQIRLELFEPILPNRRNDLYRLVRDIEESGGWPYIERMRLQEIMTNLLPEVENTENKMP